MIKMAEYPDKFFDLAIVDPPYGIGVNHNMGRRKGDRPSNYKPATWDNEAPNEAYFKELFRISANQIIWGANHFISKMPYDSSCWLMWDKGFSEEVTFAQFELAWTSFTSTCKKFDMLPNLSYRIHPTQKPIALYKWLLKNYATPDMKIIDTHLGSGSSAIAAYDFGCDFVGCEIDKEYFDAAVKRFNIHKMQQKLF
jgi:site-specific DNA-methyltransferase (adenine-specific)